MPPPWLSVIIPTYNGEKFLTTALASIAAQAKNDIECIIVDDGSTDSTIQIINSFADRIPTTLHQGSRTGNWTANSNLALSLATGEYACFLHQDDFWLANRLQVLKELARQHPEAELVLSPAIFVDHRGDLVGRWRCPLPGKSPGRIDSGLLLERLLIQNFIAIPSPIFKRQTALKKGGLDESLWYTADWDFWFKLAACHTIYLPRPLAAFRIHAHSQTVQRSFDIAGFQQQLETVLYRYVGSLPGNHSQREAIRRDAMFSIQVNTALASQLHGGHGAFGRLLFSLVKLGPTGWQRYLRDSRIIERISARLRARIATT